MKQVVIRVKQSAFSAEKFIQSIMVYTISLLIPAGLPLLLRTIVLFIIVHLIQNRVRQYFKQPLRISYLYGIISLGFLVFVLLANRPFPVINLLYFWGFILFFNLYLALDFLSHIKNYPLSELSPGLELGFGIYKIRPKILTDSDITYLKEISKDVPDISVPILVLAKSIPFAPFITASALFILLKLLLQR